MNPQKPLSNKAHLQQYLLFGGFVYFMVNVAVVTGYATGFIGHKPLTPHAAMRMLMLCSCVLAVATPLLWWFGLRSYIGGVCICLFIVMMVFTAILNLVFYWLALAAV